MLKATLPNFSGGFSTSAHLETTMMINWPLKPFASNHRCQPSYQLHLLKKSTYLDPSLSCSSSSSSCSSTYYLVVIFRGILTIEVNQGIGRLREAQGWSVEPNYLPQPFTVRGFRWSLDSGSGPFRARRSGGDKTRKEGIGNSSMMTLGSRFRIETQRRGKN
jgi:hypothetical protein